MSASGRSLLLLLGEGHLMKQTNDSQSILNIFEMLYAQQYKDWRHNVLLKEVEYWAKQDLLISLKR